MFTPEEVNLIKKVISEGVIMTEENYKELSFLLERNLISPSVKNGDFVVLLPDAYELISAIQMRNEYIDIPDVHFPFRTNSEGNIIQIDATKWKCIPKSGELFCVTYDTQNNMYRIGRSNKSKVFWLVDDWEIIKKYIDANLVTVGEDDWSVNPHNEYVKRAIASPMIPFYSEDEKIVYISYFGEVYFYPYTLSNKVPLCRYFSESDWYIDTVIDLGNQSRRHHNIPGHVFYLVQDGLYPIDQIYRGTQEFKESLYDQN